MLLIVITVSIALVCLSCALSCIRKLLERVTAQVLLAQREKGGNVAEWLCDHGHDSLKDLCETKLA